jgi:HAD superfamily hydrolase (TIGR01509 family)
MTQLKALIFDVDGTLADTERDGHRVAFNLAFAEAGLDWDWTEEIYGQLLQVTGGKERMRFFLDNFPATRPQTADLDGYIAELHKAKTRFYTELLGQGRIPLRPGVEQLLEQARQHGIRLAIATTTTPENVTALLENTLGAASLGWFDVIAAGDIVPAKKPAPDIYVWALEQLQLQADDVIAFEDSDNGLRSARDAGIERVIVTVNGYTSEQDFTGATLVLDQLGDAGNPATVLQGTALPQGHISIEQLQQLFAQTAA